MDIKAYNITKIIAYSSKYVSVTNNCKKVEVTRKCQNLEGTTLNALGIEGLENTISTIGKTSVLQQDAGRGIS
jgi:hypothetical protein